MIESIHNLFRFYGETGRLASVSCTRNTAWSMVAGEDGSWPQMIYDVDLSENPVQKLKDAMLQAGKRNHPRFAVCDVRFFTAKDLNSLAGYGIYPVKTWTLMDTLPPVQNFNSHSSSIHIKRIVLPDQVMEFGRLVQAGLMQSVKFNPALMIQLRNHPSFSAYGLFSSGELVSGLLTFYDALSIGLYFIVTKAGFRGKGLAETLIGNVLGTFSRQQSQKVVLQAVQKAVPLYTRLGFKPQGKLVIFWKRE